MTFDEWYGNRPANRREVCREVWEASRQNALRVLASAIRKAFPPDWVQEIVDRSDPLTPFLEELRKP